MFFKGTKKLFIVKLNKANNAKYAKNLSKEAHI